MEYAGKDDQGNSFFTVGAGVARVTLLQPENQPGGSKSWVPSVRIQQGDGPAVEFLVTDLDDLTEVLQATQFKAF